MISVHNQTTVSNTSSFQHKSAHFLCRGITWSHAGNRWKDKWLHHMGQTGSDALPALQQLRSQRLLPAQRSLIGLRWDLGERDLLFDGRVAKGVRPPTELRGIWVVVKVTGWGSRWGVTRRVALLGKQRWTGTDQEPDRIMMLISNRGKYCHLTLQGRPFKENETQTLKSSKQQSVVLLGLSTANNWISNTISSWHQQKKKNTPTQSSLPR